MNAIVIGVLAACLGCAIGIVVGVALAMRIVSARVPAPPTPVPALFWAIATGCCVLAATGTTAYSLVFLASSDRTTGTVIEVREHKDSEGNVARSLAYRYTAAGQEYRETASLLDRRVFVAGDTIPIRYLRHAPAESRVDYFAYHWLFPALFAAAALVAASIAAALYWNYNRLIRRYREQLAAVPRDSMTAREMPV